MPYLPSRNGYAAGATPPAEDVGPPPQPAYVATDLGYVPAPQGYAVEPPGGNDTTYQYSQQTPAGPVDYAGVYDPAQTADPYQVPTPPPPIDPNDRFGMGGMLMPPLSPAAQQEERQQETSARHTDAWLRGIPVFNEDPTGHIPAFSSMPREEQVRALGSLVGYLQDPRLLAQDMATWRGLNSATPEARDAAAARLPRHMKWAAAGQRELSEPRIDSGNGFYWITPPPTGEHLSRDPHYLRWMSQMPEDFRPVAPLIARYARWYADHGPNPPPFIPPTLPPENINYIPRPMPMPGANDPFLPDDDPERRTYRA